MKINMINTGFNKEFELRVPTTNTTQHGKNIHVFCQKISAKTSHVQFTQ